MDYSVRDVVCDYGVYEGEELRLICNSRMTAEFIVYLLKLDEQRHREFIPLDIEG